MNEIAEQTALTEVKRRLIQEFPAIAPTDVDPAISQAHTSLTFWSLESRLGGDDNCSQGGSLFGSECSRADSLVR